MSQVHGRGRALVLALGALGVSLAREASAADYEVQAQTAAQAYEVTSPWNNVALERRRLMQTLGFAAYHLQGDHVPGEGDLQVRMMLRLDTDFGLSSHLDEGASGGETTFGVESGSHFVPGIDPARVDVMFAYVEGRDLAGGWLGFKAGRQPLTDVLGWWSFDGGLVRVTTPFFAQIELYGGLEQRGGLPLSTSRYEAQGVWRGSHGDYDSGARTPTAGDTPSFQEPGAAPAFGFALESNGPNWVHGRLSYRRVYNTGPSITQQFPDPNGGSPTVDGLRLSSERIGYAANAGLPSVGGIKGGFAYDLYNQLVSHAFGGAELYLTDQVIVGADVDHFEPIFDADSIFNWFTKEPSTTLTGRAEIEITDEVSLSAWGGGKVWRTEGDPDALGQAECDALQIAGTCPSPDVFANPNDPAVVRARRAEDARETNVSVDGLGSLAGRYRSGLGSIELRSMLQAGERGRRVGGEVAGEKPLDGGRFTLGARVSGYDWADPTREDRDATSFGYVLAGGFHPVQEAKVRLEWEHSVNELVGSRFRVLGLVDVLVLR